MLVGESPLFSFQVYGITIVIAMLTAAIYAAIGPHLILHISSTSRTWSSHGRAAQHTSHAVFQWPQH
jgi:hypothetical protein